MKILLTEDQYKRIFLNEQDPNNDYNTRFNQLKEDLLNNWNSMSKLEKMRYILPDHFSDHGWHSEWFFTRTRLRS
jgi:hypothetical protein